MWCFSLPKYTGTNLKQQAILNNFFLLKIKGTISNKTNKALFTIQCSYLINYTKQSSIKLTIMCKINAKWDHQLLNTETSASAKNVTDSTYFLAKSIVTLSVLNILHNNFCHEWISMWIRKKAYSLKKEMSILLKILNNYMFSLYLNFVTNMWHLEALINPLEQQG